MKADLHTHSIYSDGFHTPEQIAEIARAAGVQILSITDHDNMDGNELKRAAVEAAGIIYVPGWEVSAYAGYKVHITGYNCNTLSSAYISFMRERVEGSYARAEDIINKLAKNGIYITLADVEECHPIKTSPVHTMHIARAVAAKGYFKDEFEVYRQCLCRGRFAYSSLARPTPTDAVKVIRESGGISSVAHPGRIEADFAEREQLIKTLADCGLNGIEAVYSTHTVEETEYFKRLAGELSLLVTGGSDMHRQAFEGRFVGLPLFEPDEKLLAALKISC